jgi:hypothetical protein
MDAEDYVDAQLWARMPLAEATLAVWRFVFDEQRLEHLWQEHRGRCYEKVVSFATMTHLVADALLQYRGSGRRSFQKNIEAGQLQSSFQAVFGKLGRLPLDVSQALLREGTGAVRELFPPGSARQLPASLQGMEALVIDGKTIKKVAKRLKPLRGVGGGLLGGKALVAMEWTTGLALAMQTHPDGDASEKRLVKELLPQTEATVSKPRLFVADRAFCDLVQTAYFTARPGDHFVVRHHGGAKFTRDPERAQHEGLDGAGRRYRETWGWLGSVANKGRRYVRCLRLVRPGEDDDLVLMTDLLDEAAYPATDLLWLYHERWDIERMFQKVTEVFGLERLIGGTPQACIFQLAFCLLLYNIVQLLTSYVAQARSCPVEELSQEKLFDDVHEQLTAWHVVMPLEKTQEHFAAAQTATQLRARLEALLAATWSELWRKARPQANRRPSQHERKRGHGSVYRIIRAHTGPLRQTVQATARC